MIPEKFNTCFEKQTKVIDSFRDCPDEESKYKRIILLGKKLAPLSSEEMCEKNLVSGCQSKMYLHSEFIKGKIYFRAYSDALISAGLATLMLDVYSGESPETILKCPAQHLESLKIHTSLSPTRSNGLSSLYLRMKQDALRFLMQSPPAP